MGTLKAIVDQGGGGSKHSSTESKIDGMYAQAVSLMRVCVSVVKAQMSACMVAWEKRENADVIWQNLDLVALVYCVCTQLTNAAAAAAGSFCWWLLQHFLPKPVRRGGTAAELR